eukprot:Seg1052.3 transcript_id=Seg1052.3/GoldUCD/mRNA.D3Y31 product="Methylthioribose-1-phosphate isomerase" protein_id=Seg1052.3/GoldUCD/D3Y31
MATLEAIKYANGQLHILDQLQLPQKSVTEQIKTVEDGWHAIKDMKVSFDSLPSNIRKLDHAFCTETRPYNQGARLTAYELVYEKIPATLIVDSAVSLLMTKHKLAAVVVGADRVVANGDTANKIGTYQLAITAKFHNVPFYIAAPTTTIDFNLKSGNDIVIEERSSEEITHVSGIRRAAEGINVFNPAFDVTPAALITGGIITEYGVFEANKLEAELKPLVKR